MSSTTTPETIDENIKRFAETIRPHSSNELTYIDISPMQGAKPGMCFYNVQDRVKANGGEIQYGWIIWKWQNLMLEAEFHSIWKDTSGNLIDITPTTDGEKQILFLPDNKKIFEGNVVNNIRYPLISNPKLDEYISIATKITELRNKSRSGTLSTYKEEIIKLSKRLNVLQCDLLHSKIKIGRNEKCPCGSGKKHKNCCGLNE